MPNAKTEARVIAAFARLRELNAQAKDIDSEVSSLKEELKALVPANGELGGVRHVISSHSTVSYAKVYDALLETLIPKTKAQQAADIRASFTTISERHELKAID
jgi:hypothetical protein